MNMLQLIKEMFSHDWQQSTFTLVYSIKLLRMWNKLLKGTILDFTISVNNSSRILNIWKYLRFSGALRAFTGYILMWNFKMEDVKDKDKKVGNALSTLNSVQWNHQKSGLQACWSWSLKVLSPMRGSLILVWTHSNSSSSQRQLSITRKSVNKEKVCCYSDSCHTLCYRTMVLSLRQRHINHINQGNPLLKQHLLCQLQMAAAGFVQPSVNKFIIIKHAPIKR